MELEPLLIIFFSDNIIHDVIGYNTIDLIYNLSDHLPLFALFKCSGSYVHALLRIFNASPNCFRDQIKINCISSTSIIMY